MGSFLPIQVQNGTLHLRRAAGSARSPFAIECNERFALHREDDATSEAGALHDMPLCGRYARRPRRGIVPRAVGCRSILKSQQGGDRLVKGHDALSWGAMVLRSTFIQFGEELSLYISFQHGLES